MTRQFNSAIISNRRLSDEYFELELEWPTDLVQPEPGQFVSLRTRDFNGSLLKRPFAVASFTALSRNSFSMIIQRRGPATILFSELCKGDVLNVTGPLGHPFPLPEQGSRPVLLGGGIGLGPVLYLASFYLAAGLDPLLVLGYRSESLVPDLSGKTLPETLICTDDGSSGFYGNIVDYLVKNNPGANTTFYACGPDKMLEACENFAAGNGSKIWISVEQTMACGIGACMGCVIPVNDNEKRFVRVCKEGPVFPGGYLKWT